MSINLTKNTNYHSLLPFHTFYYDPNHPPASWKTDTCLYFVLAGTCEVIAAGRTVTMQSEDVFLINAGIPLQIAGSTWQIASIEFDAEQLFRSMLRQPVRFDVCSAGNTFATKYDFIRYCLSQLVHSVKKEEGIFNTLSVFYALFSHLISNHPAPPLETTDNRQNQEKVLEIIRYMNEHYQENLTLSNTASHFGLTAPYFATLFKKQTGRTFLDFYNDIRLSQAMKALLSSNAPIERIATEHGFTDSRSFTSLFKRRYGLLPNAYRRNRKLQAETKRGDMANAAADDLTAADTSAVSVRGNILRNPAASSTGSPGAESSGTSPRHPGLTSFPSLSKYASIFREENEFSYVLSENPRIIDVGTVDYHAPLQHLTHNYHTMICVGSAKQFLYGEVQDMLRRVQKEIHFRYAKFHGLLSDDMMVYSEDAAGTPHYSFTLIDKVFDFMQSIDMKPLVQLSFMPIALAEDPSRLVDFYHYNTSPPKNLKKWTDLVSAVVLHLLQRYGLEEVKTWLFCVWNEPDETVDQFAWPNRTRFYDFYRSTYRAVKSVCPDLKFGTPSLLLSLQEETGWASGFFQYTVLNSCQPDFMNIHYYDNSMFEEDMSDRFRSDRGFSLEFMEQSFPLTVDPYAFMKYINSIKSMMRRYNMRSLPIYLTEWNLTISHRDLINDTCFKSCHLIKNLLENYDRLESFSYWSLTDFIEELQISDDLYHGGLGLFTYNGIPKANYNAFLLLTHLGNELLSKGDGYFITRSENRISIMLYNYEHYSKLFAAGSRSEITDTNRYAPFEEMSTAQFTVRLSGLEAYTHALVKERFVNQYAGSSYDAWARMGARPIDSPDDLAILHQQSLPGLYLHQETIEGGTLTLHARMAPLEVRLLEVELE